MCVIHAAVTGDRDPLEEMERFGERNLFLFPWLEEERVD